MEKNSERLPCFRILKGKILSIKFTYRSAHVVAQTIYYILDLERADYNKSIRSVNEKRIKERIEDFKKKNIAFKDLPKQVLTKLIHVFVKSRFNKGEYLYKQFDKSKYIYFIFNGKIEISVNININDSSDLLSHISDSKINLIKILQVKGITSEDFLDRLIEHCCN